MAGRSVSWTGTDFLAQRLEELIPREPLLQVFRFNHLPSHLLVVSAGFAELACFIVSDLPRNPERTVALRKLREAKDCAVTAVLWEET